MKGIQENIKMHRVTVYRHICTVNTMKAALQSDRVELLFYHQGYIAWSPSEISKQIQFVNKKGP